MVPTFQYNSDFDSGRKYDMLLEVSNTGISYLIIDDTRSCRGLAIYQLPRDSDKDIAGFMLEILSENIVFKYDYAKTTVVFADALAGVIPGEFINTSSVEQILEMIHGDISGTTVRSDFIYQQNIHVVYGVQHKVENVLNAVFSVYNQKHLFSLLPDFIDSEVNEMHCIFRVNALTVMFTKGGQIQLLQNFSYKTPEDVVYYLLQICQSYGVLISDLRLVLYGMIESSSLLYKEIEKYFLHMIFSNMPVAVNEFPEELKKYSGHYFAHLFLTATCV